MLRAVAGAAAAGVVLLSAGPAASAPGDPTRKLTPAGEKAAFSFVLRKADLPAGSWRVMPSDFSQANPACVVRHYSLAALTVTGEAGRTFTLASGSIVESDGHIFRDADQARQAFAIVSKRGFPQCVGSSLAASVARGASGSVRTSVRIERFTLAGLAAAAYGFRAALRFHSSRGDGSLDVTYVALRRGRGFALLSLARYRGAWPDSVARSLAQKMATRMPAS